MSKMRLLVENKILVSETEEECCINMRSSSLGVWYQLHLLVGYFFTRNVSMLKNQMSISSWI
jgi:hypothetical protein